MPAPTIPRTPIQKFTKAELDEADLCARALWYGINFEKSGKITSDAWLLDAFATPFYKIPSTNNAYVGVTDLDVHELIVACKLYATFRDTNKQHYRGGLSVVASTIYPIYTNWLHKSGLSNEAYGALAVHKLSDALALRSPSLTKPNPHRTVIASRIMFFLVPTMPCFNMNNTVALKYGLQSRPYAYRDEYCSLMYDGLRANWSLLKTYKLPDCTHEIAYETWEKINESDWWQRRVLDIAVLIKNGLASAVVGLSTIYKRHTDELKAKGLI